MLVTIALDQQQQQLQQMMLRKEVTYALLVITVWPEPQVQLHALLEHLDQPQVQQSQLIVSAVQLVTIVVQSPQRELQDLVTLVFIAQLEVLLLSKISAQLDIDVQQDLALKLHVQILTIKIKKVKAHARLVKQVTHALKHQEHYEDLISPLLVSIVQETNTLQ